jgi:hypothetical protein
MDMQLEQQNFFRRLWTMFRLLWPNPFHRSPRSTETRSSAPAGWKKLPKPTGPIADLGELRRVIPLVRSEHAAGMAVTLISLEIYDGGFLVHGQFPAKYGERSLENIWMAHPTFAVTDDIGTEYRWCGSGGSGTRFMPSFAPAPNPTAHELRVTATHIQWIFTKERRYELDEGPWSFKISLD